MKASFKLVVAATIAMLAAGPAWSASKDATPFPPPNPFKTAAPAQSSAAPPKTKAAATYDHDTAAGFWQETDDQGRPGAWFLFVEKDGFYQGRIVKMFKAPGEQELVKICRKCPGDQKDAPMLGLTIIKGMKREGNQYTGGTILDPRDGTVYHAEMELSADGQELSVRGYLGIPLFGQTQVWTRLPDDALAPEDIPADSTGPDATPK